MTMWCAIRTFTQHARELGNAPVEQPIVFVKPTNCLHEGGPLPVSTHPGEVHHEVECVVKLGDDLQPVAIAVGLDLTDRAAQSALRAKQYPWAKGKTFRSSAVVGPWSAWDHGFDALIAEEHALELHLSVNGEVRQSAPLATMSVTPRAQLDELMSWAPLKSGDLLFTGTPKGVGPLLPGDHLHASLTMNGVVLSEILLSCQ
jgi:fumarylpyruvate hydrolase